MEAEDGHQELRHQRPRTAEQHPYRQPPIALRKPATCHLGVDERHDGRGRQPRAETARLMPGSTSLRTVAAGGASAGPHAGWSRHRRSSTSSSRKPGQRPRAGLEPGLEAQQRPHRPAAPGTRDGTRPTDG